MERVFKNQFNNNLGMAVIALVFTAFLGCRGNLQPDFNGTYVNHASSEFSIADDTLVVEQVKEQQYIIRRKTGYREIAESGKVGPIQQHSETWKAVYNPDTRVMTESRKGRTLTFEKGTLTLERSTYRRIN
jgi:hypothetical protein